MESSVDLFERQMATNQRVIKFRKNKSEKILITDYQFGHPIPGHFEFHRVFLTGPLYFLWWKEKLLFADQIGWSTESFISPANSQLLNFSLFWKLDSSNWWNLMIEKSRNAQKRKFAQRDAWDHWDCANPLHTHLTSSQHQSPPGFGAFQENIKVGKGEERI